MRTDWQFCIHAPFINGSEQRRIAVYFELLFAWSTGTGAILMDSLCTYSEHLQTTHKNYFKSSKFYCLPFHLQLQFYCNSIVEGILHVGQFLKDVHNVFICPRVQVSTRQLGLW